MWRDATRTVFGEGRPDAEVMLVGEQPGDVEDRTGRPFAGPAGKPRAPDDDARADAYRGLVEDLAKVAKELSR